MATKKEILDAIERQQEHLTNLVNIARRPGETDEQVLMRDPFLCGQAYMLSKILMWTF